MHVQPGWAAAAKRDGRWPRSQPSYPELESLEAGWGKGFSGDAQKLLFGSSTRLSSVVGFGNGAQSVVGGTARSCSTAFP